MKRKLVIVYGNCQKIEESLVLTLKEDDADKIDRYTIKYENSDKIKSFAWIRKKMDEFYKANKSYIDETNKKQKDKSSGKLVILDSDTKEAKHVLYKKHYYAFCKLYQDETFRKKVYNFLCYLSNKGDKKVSDFILRYFKTYNYKKVLKELKGKKYEFIRMFLRYYEYLRNKDDLPSIESLYEQFLFENEEKKANKEALEQFLISQAYNEREFDMESPQFIDLEDGNRGIEFDGEIYNVDEFPFDNDDILGHETDYHPDGLGPRNEFTKRIK